MTDDIHDKKIAFENGFSQREIEIHPYLILRDDLTGIHQVFLILNKEFYPCKDQCFKCLLALRCWPYTCDQYWYFLMKRVYGLKPPESCAVVNRLCTNLNKLALALSKQVVKVGNVAPLLFEQPDIDELVSIESDMNVS